MPDGFPYCLAHVCCWVYIYIIRTRVQWSRKQYVKKNRLWPTVWTDAADVANSNNPSRPVASLIYIKIKHIKLRANRPTDLKPNWWLNFSAVQARIYVHAQYSDKFHVHSRIIGENFLYFPSLILPLYQHVCGEIGTTLYRTPAPPHSPDIPRRFIVYTI